MDEAKERKSANYLDKRFNMSVIFSSKKVRHLLQFLKSELYCFSFFLSFMTVNKEALGFGPSIGRIKRSGDVTVSFMKL